MHVQTPFSGVIRKIFFFVVLGGAVSPAPQASASLIHQYQFTGSFADDLGGPALVAAGGTLGTTSYTFGANQGLSLINGLTDIASYSIELVFHLSALSGYRKIIDFKNRTADDGLYNFNTALNFYPIATGSTGAFSSGVDVRLVATRNKATNQFVGYVNGTQQIAFTDSANRAVFTGLNGIIQFLRDDTVVTGEVSAGVIDLIRIYDAPLSASEVTRLMNPVSIVPEPSTLLLLASAFGLLGCGWLRQWRMTKIRREQSLSL